MKKNEQQIVSNSGLKNKLAICSEKAIKVLHFAQNNRLTSTQIGRVT
jgi:hypothetical protein